MKIGKKILRKNTIHIKDGVMLEKVRGILFKSGESTLWGYDETYINDDVVSSGFLHYEKGFYLSKESFDKQILSEEEFNSFLVLN